VRCRPSAVVASASIVLAVVACASGPRDLVVDSPRVIATDGGAGSAAAPSSQDTYVYVTRRAHGVVGLAEARAMTDADARALVDRIADDFETCARRLDAQGALVEGAARVVAVADANGTPGVNLKHAPGGTVAQNALMCLVAPVRALPFPKSGGMAIEATWGPSATTADQGKRDAGG
jgi:hypothetical protein